MQKKLSIIVPIFNAETYISESLESVKRAIKDIPAEVILVDDHSTDKSSDIAKAFAEKEEAFEYYINDKQGVSCARNYGIKKASGKYLGFADADDVVHEDMFAELIDVAEEYGCDMVICDAIRTKNQKKSYSSLHRKAYYNIRNLQISLEEDPLLIFDSTVWNRIIRRELYLENNIQFPPGLIYEDFPVVQMMHFCSDNVRFVRNWGYEWRIRTDGISSITKSHTNTKNLTDKIKTLEIARENAKAFNAPPEYFKNLDYRILSLEFNGTIAVLKEIPEDKALEHIDTAAKYIESCVNLDAVKELPLYDKQKIECILRRDLPGLIRLMNYKSLNYDNAPVIKNGESYEAVLPKQIFTIEDRDFRYEYARIPFYQGVDNIEVSETAATIHAHIYLRRIEVPSTESQKVSAVIVNAKHDGEILLDTCNELRPELTRNKGQVISTDDYTDYSYNYDGAGFRFEIDFDALSKDERFRGRNYILLSCENDIGETQQILRYASKTAKKQLQEGISCEKNGCSINISLNEIEVIEINVNEIVANEEEIEESSDKRQVKSSSHLLSRIMRR